MHLYMAYMFYSSIYIPVIHHDISMDSCMESHVSMFGSAHAYGSDELSVLNRILRDLALHYDFHVMLSHCYGMLDTCEPHYYDNP